jgi:STE24 endopeptidase
MSIALFFAYLVVIGMGYWLRSLNLSYLKTHGHEVPPEFEGTVDPASLRRISDYTIENSRLGLVESVLGNIFLIIFLFGGLLGVYDQWVASLTGSFVWRGVLFVLVLLVAETVIGIPFSLYSNFKIENRYGFNTMTLRLWVGDLFKSTAISAVLGIAVVATALAIIQASPAWWWLWVWAFLLLFGVFVMYISPSVIEPLFFKFGPVAVEGLEEKIRTLMERAGLKVGRVFQVDASRRSRHSNAYFTGIGRVKRIVLFDTLIGQMSQDEILAVLAHEVGHWKKRHVLKRIIQSELTALCGLFLAYHALSWDGLSRLIGLADASFYVRMVIVGFLGSIVMFPLTPLSSFLSRRDEREADRFASELTARPDAMASALVKLSRENLSNLHPHPVYAKFYYSHPPVVERVRSLRGQKTDDRHQTSELV